MNIDSLADFVRSTEAMHDAVAVSLSGFGGILRCRRCGQTGPVGDAGHNLAHGWPKCCGYTMRWWTQRQIDAGEMPV